MNICRNFNFYCLPKNYFTSISKRRGLYSKENLKLLKIFKFTRDPEKKAAMEDKQQYLQNLMKIKIIEKEILREDKLSFTKTSKESKQETFTLKKSEEDGAEMEEVEEPLTLGHKYPIENEEHSDKRDELNELLMSMKAFNRNFEQNYLTQSKEIQLEYGHIKASMFRDVFSSSYSFGNRMLNPLFFESVNQSADEKPGQLVRDEDELNVKQHNLESEITSIVDEMLNRDLKNFDVDKTVIKHNLPVKPIIRTVLAQQNQPDILLMEGDLSCNYDLNLEYERLIRLNQNDDFGRQIKDEQAVDEDDQEEDIAAEEVNDKDLYGLGNSPSMLSVDTSISVIANK